MRYTVFTNFLKCLDRNSQTIIYFGKKSFNIWIKNGVETSSIISFATITSVSFISIYWAFKINKTSGAVNFPEILRYANQNTPFKAYLLSRLSKYVNLCEKLNNSKKKDKIHQSVSGFLWNTSQAAGVEMGNEKFLGPHFVFFLFENFIWSKRSCSFHILRR